MKVKPKAFSVAAGLEARRAYQTALAEGRVPDNPRRRDGTPQQRNVAPLENRDPLHLRHIDMAQAGTKRVRAVRENRRMQSFARTWLSRFGWQMRKPAIQPKPVPAEKPGLLKRAVGRVKEFFRRRAS